MSKADITKAYERPPASGGEPKQIVLLLHGLGSNGRDLIGLAPYWAEYLSDALFISPDAPFPCDMVPPGYPDSFQWFSLQSRDPKDMLAGAEIAAPILERFIKQVSDKYKVAFRNIMLVGFSQGTMTSLYAAPRFKERVAGVLGYSGALVGGEGLSAAGIHKIPVHLIHGEADDVVPVLAYTAARKTLENVGFNVSGHTTPGLPHSIDEAGIQSGGEFLRKTLA